MTIHLETSRNALSSSHFYRFGFSPLQFLIIIHWNLIVFIFPHHLRSCSLNLKERKEMPIDLVGRLHRTLLIERCHQHVHEDLAKMLHEKCGPVEDWDSTEARLTVVFRKLDAMSNGLAFNGMLFGGTGKPIAVWAGNGQPPAGVEQLLLGGPASFSGGGAASAACTTEGEAAAAKKRRLELMQDLQKTAHAQESAEVSDTAAGMSAAEKRFRLLTMTMRQTTALGVLTDAAVVEAEAALAETMRQLASTDGLAARLARR